MADDQGALVSGFQQPPEGARVPAGTVVEALAAGEGIGPLVLSLPGFSTDWAWRAKTKSRTARGYATEPEAGLLEWPGWRLRSKSLTTIVSA